MGINIKTASYFLIVVCRKLKKKKLYFFNLLFLLTNQQEFSKITLPKKKNIKFLSLYESIPTDFGLRKTSKTNENVY